MLLHVLSLFLLLAIVNGLRIVSLRPVDGCKAECRVSPADAVVSWLYNGTAAPGAASRATHDTWLLDVTGSCSPGRYTCLAVLIPPDGQRFLSVNQSLALPGASHRLLCDPLILAERGSDVDVVCSLTNGGAFNGSVLEWELLTRGSHEPLAVAVSELTAALGNVTATLRINDVSPLNSGLYVARLMDLFNTSTAVVSKDLLRPARVRAVSGAEGGTSRIAWLPPAALHSLPSGSGVRDLLYSFGIVPSPTGDALDGWRWFYRVSVVDLSSGREETRAILPDQVDPGADGPTEYITAWDNLTLPYNVKVALCIQWRGCGEPAELKQGPPDVFPVNVTLVCYHDHISLKHFLMMSWQPPVVAVAQPALYQVEITWWAEFRDERGLLRRDSGELRHRAATTHFMLPVAANTVFSARVCLLGSGGGGCSNQPTCSTPPTGPSVFPTFSLQKAYTVNASWSQVQLDVHRISERDGTIRCYRIYVLKLVSARHLLPDTLEVNASTYSEVHEAGSGAYIAEAFTSQDFRSEVTLGDGNQSYCLLHHDGEGLESELLGIMGSRAAGEVRQSPRGDALRDAILQSNSITFDGPLATNSAYSGFVEVVVEGADGKPVYRRSAPFAPIMTSAVSDPADGGGAPVALLGVVCGAFAVLLILTVALCLTRKKMSVAEPGGADIPMLPQPKTESIAADKLVSAFIERQKDSGLLFQREFELLPEYFKSRTTKCCDALENIHKNRYPDIKAYDQTRVKLSPYPGVPGSDYINANFVAGYRNRKSYICAQGPLDKTVVDFWRMIWEHKINVIAAVTGLEENGKVKCAKYWPEEGSSATYGELSVTCTGVTVFGEYAVRRFIVERNGGEFAITQYHYLAWRDFIAPDHPGGILRFIRRVHQQPGSPTLVHCSAGVGRTGTLVVISSLIDQLDEEGAVNVFEFVSLLRQQRNFLVQSLAQYVFIYRVLMEYAQFGNTETSAESLRNRFMLLDMVADDGRTRLQTEFEKLDEVIEDVKTTEVGNMDGNMSKNRYDYIVPYDKNRVVLSPVGVDSASTYINASLIQGYRRSSSYIITQDPLEATIGDFWRMTQEHGASVIVMLSEAGSGQTKCPVYWPDKEATYGPVRVTLEDEADHPHFRVRKFLITNTKWSRSQPVTHVQFLSWGDEERCVPPTTQPLLNLVQFIHQLRDDPEKADEPIVVHCTGGGDRSSVFVAVSILAQQISAESQADVFQVARNLRTQRKYMIRTEDQYRFLYLAACDYLD